jgi:hypothetical protein
MQGKCQTCSRLFFRLKAIVFRLRGGESECLDTFDRISSIGSNRVAALFSAIPQCGCECCKVSTYSPGPIKGSETIARHVIHPLHVASDGTFKPSLFSHAFNRGCSVQREKIASDAAVVKVIQNIVAGATDGAWFGMIYAKARDLRNIVLSERRQRAICLYDTAESDNFAHAEIFLSREIAEADENELRSDLSKCFGGGAYELPENYRRGEIWKKIGQPMRDKTVAGRAIMRAKLAKKQETERKAAAKAARRAAKEK